MPEITLDRRIEAVRSFNRFYTKQVGVLQEGLLESDFSLTEVRVLYELAHRENLTASEILKDLGLDRGYLSRILASFEQRGLIAKKTSKTDSRQCDLSLAARGRKALAPLEKRSQKEVAAMLGTLPAPEQNRLVQAMQTIQSLLGPKAENKVSYILRPHRPGDMGWIIHRHGVLYSQEYGWDESFEGLVAEIAAKFIQNFDPAGSVAGSRRKMAGPLAASFWFNNQKRLRNCASYWWNLQPAGSESANAWCRSAFVSPARQVTRR
jgi:DNA-binding MarR family transcriptional regulator